MLVKPSKQTCLVFDRIGLSNQFASLAYLTIARDFGLNPDDVTCSTSTIFRLRRTYRESEAANIYNTFEPNARSILHWDCKSYSTGVTGIYEKRIAVALSSAKEAKLLDVCQISDGTAANCTEAILNITQAWNSHDCIIGMCFDNENTNSGIKHGVATRIEKKLKKNMFYLACRHHIHEIILSAVFSNTVERGLDTDGSKIPLFEKFRNLYFRSNAVTPFDKTNYKGYFEDNFFIHQISENEVQDLVDYCKNTLNQSVPRDDYAEFLKLVIIFLSPRNGTTFKVQSPGPYNRARYMCRVIYCFKIYLYQDQMGPILDLEKLQSIRLLILFVLKVYLKNWFQATDAIKAPNNDLNLMKNIRRLRSVMPDVVVSTLDKMMRHLWYLSEKLVILSLFDENVSIDAKIHMVRNLRTESKQTNPNRAIHRNKPIRNLRLADFVSKKSKLFFQILNINIRFCGSIHVVGQSMKAT